MRTKPYRKGDRLIELVISGVFALMKRLFRSPRLAWLDGGNIIGLMGFFFIFFSFTCELFCFVRAGGLRRLACGQFCSARYESL
jgi:hypothetical protein